MNVHVFETPEAQAIGLQHMKRVDPDTLYVFPLVDAGSLFHSRNVPEPFDLAFLSEDHIVLSLVTVFPEKGVATAPPGTAMALEAKDGNLRKWGIVPGADVSPFTGEGGP